MKPPKCRLCGHHHWNHEPHVFKDSDPGETRKAEKKGAPGKPVSVGVTDKTQNGRKRKDYNAYQRQYMRWVRSGKVGEFKYDPE